MLAFLKDANILFVFLTWLLERSASGSSLRIVGGRDTEPNTFPYVVRMEVTYTEKTDIGLKVVHVHVCTASAVTASWSLSAAHCVDGLDEIIQIVHMEPNLDQPKGILRYKSVSGYPSELDSKSDIVSTHKHPAYKIISIGGDIMYNDVALLKTTPVRLEVYAKVSAADFSTLVGQRTHVVGYGLTSIGSIISSTMSLGKSLQMLEVIIKNCDDESPLLYPALCVSSHCGRTSSLCPGDSGGPLLHVSGIVGINSLGNAYDCQIKYVKKKISSKDIGFITPISPYLEWIADKLKKNDPVTYL